MTTYLLVREAPAVPGQCCQGRLCARLLRDGETITLVAHARRACDAPGSDGARAYLCSDCTARLGDALDREPSRGVRVPLPTHIRGKPIESW